MYVRTLVGHVFILTMKIIDEIFGFVCQRTRTLFRGMFLSHSSSKFCSCGLLILEMKKYVFELAIQSQRVVVHFIFYPQSTFFMLKSCLLSLLDCSGRKAFCD